MDVFGDEFVLYVEDVLSHDICVDDAREAGRDSFDVPLDRPALPRGFLCERSRFRIARYRRERSNTFLTQNYTSTTWASAAVSGASPASGVGGAAEREAGGCFCCVCVWKAGSVHTYLRNDEQYLI